MEQPPIRFDLKKLLTFGRAEKPGLHENIIRRSDGYVTETYQVNADGRYDKTTGLRFTDGKGHSYNLLEGLPEGTELRSFKRDFPGVGKDMLLKAFSGKRRQINYGDLSQDGSLITFLHEKGHTIAIEEGLHPENTSEGNPLEAYKSQYPMRGLEQLHAEGEDPNNFLKLEYTSHEDEDRKTKITYVPMDVVMQFAKYLAHREKTANDIMEKEFREIRNKGIALETQIVRDPNEITNLVLIQLSTYGLKIPLLFEPVDPTIFNASAITEVFTDGKSFTPVNVGIFRHFLDEISKAIKMAEANSTLIIP